MNDIATQDNAMMETVLIKGDLAGLTPAQRYQYYLATCNSLGLNPLTKPFDYIQLNGKLVLYAKRDCADQLRKINGVSISIASRELVGEVYVVTAQAQDANGRHDESTGAVCVQSLRGEALANAYMKAETKAKRRVTLSICGLGIADETEIETIPSARPFDEHQAPPAIAPPQEKTNGNGNGSRTITDPQVKRLFAILKQSGKTPEDLKTYLSQFGLEHSKDIPMSAYESVCEWAASQ